MKLLMIQNRMLFDKYPAAGTNVTKTKLIHLVKILELI